MYEIILKTWYQEKPDERYDEVYKNLGFKDMIDVIEYLSNNSETILYEFPVDGEIIIKYNNDRHI
jgi:hypothetical protein